MTSKITEEEIKESVANLALGLTALSIKEKEVRAWIAKMNSSENVALTARGMIGGFVLEAALFFTGHSTKDQIVQQVMAGVKDYIKKKDAQCHWWEKGKQGE